MSHPGGVLPHLIRDGFSPTREIIDLRDSPGSSGVLRLPGPAGRSTWVVTRQDDVRAVLADAATFSSAGFVPAFTAAPHDDAGDPQAGSLLTTDPPDHTRWRRMLSREFTVRRIRALEPRITEIVEGFLDDMAAAGPPADLVTAFALPIPSLVICEMLGVPYSDRDQFQNRMVTQAQGIPDAAELDRIRAESRAYLDTLAERAMTDPGEDMLGMLVREHPDEITPTALDNIADLLLFAGHETTASLLGVATLALLQNPAQRDAVRDDPDAVGPAVEELLRFCSVLQMSIPRTATTDHVLAGHDIVAGDLVMVSLSAANRDPHLLDDGDTLDITRTPVPHVAFGHGIHHCLGAGLARAETAIALPALLRRFPALHLDTPTDQIHYRAPGVFYGLQSLSVSW